MTTTRKHSGVLCGATRAGFVSATAARKYSGIESTIARIVGNFPADDFLRLGDGVSFITLGDGTSRLIIRRG